MTTHQRLVGQTIRVQRDIGGKWATFKYLHTDRYGFARYTPGC